MPTHAMPPGIAPLANVLALQYCPCGWRPAADSDSHQTLLLPGKIVYLKNEKGELVQRSTTNSQTALLELYLLPIILVGTPIRAEFDDMVRSCRSRHGVFPDLRFNLQEKYLYIMADEFQDTNLAQARIP